MLASRQGGLPQSPTSIRYGLIRVVSLTHNVRFGCGGRIRSETCGAPWFRHCKRILSDELDGARVEEHETLITAIAIISIETLSPDRSEGASDNLVIRTPERK